MASAGTSAVRIIDSDNEVATVTSNRLDVNAYLSATPTIDIGDVSLLLGGTAADTGLGAYSSQTLRVVLAGDDLLSLYIAALKRTEDGAHSSGDNGIMSLAVRNDTLASLVSDDGDYAPLQVNSAGSLYTDIQKNLVTAGVTFANNYSMLAAVVRNDTLANLGGGGVADGDMTNVQVNALGALYITGGEVENAAVQSEPTLIGGRYDSSARTLGDGDAGAVALNASGHVLMDVVDGGQLDALLDTIKVDTEAIETAVELLDNAISGSEMQVDVVASLPAGTNAIGKLAANSGVDIGDVDVTSISAGTNIIGKVGHDITGMVGGANTDIDTSADKLDGGTDGYDVACKRVDLQASVDNTADILVGDSGVVANGSGGGIRLSPGDFYSIDIDNLTDIWVIAISANQTIIYNYFT